MPRQIPLSQCPDATCQQCGDTFRQRKDSHRFCDACIQQRRSAKNDGEWHAPLNVSELKQIRTAWFKGWLTGHPDKKQKFWDLIVQTAMKSDTRAYAYAIELALDIHRFQALGLEPTRKRRA